MPAQLPSSQLPSSQLPSSQLPSSQRARFRARLLTALLLSVLIPVADSLCLSQQPDDSTAQLERIRQLKKQAIDQPELWTELVERCDQALARNPEGELRWELIAHRFDGLRELFNQHPSAENDVFAELLKFAEDYRRSSNPDIRRTAKVYEWNLRAIRMRERKTLPSGEPANWASDTEQLLESDESKQLNFELAELAAKTLERAGYIPAAVRVYQAMLKRTENKEFRKQMPDSHTVAELGLCRVKLIGDPFEFRAVDLEGQPVTTQSLKGKVVLLDFWATHCRPCLEELPRLKRLYRKFHNRGFEIVGVNLDSDRDYVKYFVKRKEIPWPVVFDPDAPDFAEHPLVKQFCVNKMPTMFLIDQSGQIEAILLTAETLDRQLSELLENTPQEPLNQTGLRKRFEHRTGLLLRTIPSSITTGQE